MARIAERLPGVLVLQVEVTHGADDTWDDTVYVTWEGQELAEYELIRLWGTVSGRASHEGALGTRPTLPEIAATVLQKAE